MLSGIKCTVSSNPSADLPLSLCLNYSAGILIKLQKCPFFLKPDWGYNLTACSAVWPYVPYRKR